MRLFTLLLLLLSFCFVILMPAQLPIGSLRLYRPRLNLSLGTFRLFRDLNFRLGLDLQGGTHLVYQADMSQVEPNRRDEAILSAKNNIDRRINLLGVSEPVVQTSRSGEDYRLIVELPGVKDVNQALAVIGQTARLEFRELDSATDSAQPEFVPSGLTGSDLSFAQVQFDNAQSSIGRSVIALEFTPTGTQKLAEISNRNLGRPLAIFLDDQPITPPPTVQEAITDGRAVISGDFTLDQAKRLSIQLNAGALPVPIQVVQQRNIGATLGAESVTKSLFAGAVGLVIVWLFMIANYRLNGLVADFALGLYVLLSLSLFKLIPVTLTLSGIAGFILSIGMAVDANILIFERLKEELRWGRPPKPALELAFHRSWPSIRDSNISSLITALILFWLGTGSVRGFALTLTIGILVSLFTSITATRGLLRAVYSR